MGEKKTAIPTLDEEAINEQEERVIIKPEEQPEETAEPTTRLSERKELVNCLSNEIVIVRFIAKARARAPAVHATLAPVLL